MKITAFNPPIITKNGEEIIRLFEALGFEKRHDQEGIGELNVEGIRMKDTNGFYLDVSQPDLPLQRDVTAIRMNVDDFDAAYQLLLSHGFKNYYVDRINETPTAKSALMIAPSGFAINLVQHIRK